MVDTPSAVDYNSMMPEQRIELSFTQLCRRLLDIDETCHGGDKGCPFHLAALPMIKAWRSCHSQDPLPVSVTEHLRRMWSANGDGRACEFGEVKDLATQYLNSR